MQYFLIQVIHYLLPLKKLDGYPVIRESNEEDDDDGEESSESSELDEELYNDPATQEIIKTLVLWFLLCLCWNNNWLWTFLTEGLLQIDFFYKLLQQQVLSSAHRASNPTPPDKREEQGCQAAEHSLTQLNIASLSAAFLPLSVCLVNDRASGTSWLNLTLQLACSFAYLQVALLHSTLEPVCGQEVNLEFFSVK